MDNSRVYSRIFYLIELGSTSPRNRIIMLENITPGQMDAIGVIAKCIVEGRIQIMDRDSNYFTHRRRLLRVIAEHHTPFTRKQRILLRQHKMIPRLLRVFYLRRVMLVELRLNEE